VCKRCGQKFTDQRWEETTAHRTVWQAGDVSVCGACHAADITREEAAAEGARPQAAMPPEPEHDQEPDKLRGLFRRRG
jgi:mono/diheme cytochrome c family protein